MFDSCIFVKICWPLKSGALLKCLTVCPDPLLGDKMGSRSGLNFKKIKYLLHGN